MNTLEELYSYTAKVLSGRRVKILWRRPVIPGYIGMCSRRGRLVIIEIDSMLTDERKFHEFLHEVAHAKIHYEMLADESDVRRGAGDQRSSWLLPSREEVDEYQERERQARELADEWYEMVKWVPGIEARLVKLCRRAGDV